jgi:hypothetical protein
MDERLYFTYERISPFLYPNPRNIKQLLTSMFFKEYKNSRLSDIPYTTEIIVKSIKNKDPTKMDYVLLKYRIINVDWEELRSIKDVNFDPKKFRLLDTTEKNYDE